MGERLPPVDHTLHTTPFPSPVLNMRHVLYGSVLGMLVTNHGGIPSQRELHPPLHSAPKPMQTMEQQRRLPKAQCLAHSPIISADPLENIAPGTDLFNRRFTVDEGSVPMGIDLDAQKGCVLVIGDIQLPVLAVKDPKGEVREITITTVKTYQCQLHKTKTGMRASAVIIPWFCEPSCELTDAEVRALKQETLRTLKEMEPGCTEFTLTIAPKEGGKGMEVTFKVPAVPIPQPQLAALGAP